MLNINNGYKGHSMSQRAVTAYENNEKPFSRWSKKDILDEIERIIKEEETRPNFNIEDLQKFNTTILRDTFLKCASWHHTSSKFNKTDFYSINYSAIENITIDKLKLIASLEKEEKQKQAVLKNSYEYAKIIYEEWEGSKRYGKFVKKEENVIIVGNWGYIIQSFGLEKKKLDGNHILNIKKLGKRKPKNFNTKNVSRIKKELGL